MIWRYAALAALLSLAGCSKPAEPETEVVRTVEVAEARPGPIDRVIPAEGVLRAVDQSAVTPKISAPVNRFLVNRGDHVTQGQLLAVLENRDLQAAVLDAKGALDQAESSLRNISKGNVPEDVTKAQADVSAARQAMDAAQKLLQSRQQLFQDGAIARRLVDEAGVSYAQAKSQYDTVQQHLSSVEGVSRVENVKSAEAQVESARGRYDAAVANLSYSEIHAPIGGVVAERPLYAGELAQPGTPLMTVMDISSVIARANVPLAQARYVQVGQSAQLAASDGNEGTGIVTVVSPAVDPQATTLEVWVRASNSGGRLRPGSTVHLSINAGNVGGALLVPSPALLPSTEGGTAIFTVDAKSVAHEHKVEVGLQSGGQAQILSGIQAGDRVVIAGGLGLEDGATVKVGPAGGKAE